MYINGRILGARISGVPRYARELLKALDVQLTESGDADHVDVEVIIPSSIEETFSFQSIQVRRVGHLAGHLWEQFELPFFTWDGVLFGPSGSAPLLHPRNVVTIHDASVFAFPEGFSARYRTLHRILSRILARTAKRIFTVSQFSKSELVRWCKARPERISVVYPGAQHLRSVDTDDSIQQRLDLHRFRYVLAVGSSNPNKNFNTIVQAAPYLAAAEVEVVLVGQTGQRVGRHGAKRELLDFSIIKNAGFVSDGELRSLYENAGCFVFPSLYEGFGIPPLEALSLGCPTVISNAASLPEICGEVAILCDPHNPHDIAQKALEAIRLRKDPSEAEKSSTFAAKYTYRRSASEVWRVLKPMLLDGRPTIEE